MNAHTLVKKHKKKQYAVVSLLEDFSNYWYVKSCKKTTYHCVPHNFSYSRAGHSKLGSLNSGITQSRIYMEIYS